MTVGAKEADDIMPGDVLEGLESKPPQFVLKGAPIPQNVTKQLATYPHMAQRPSRGTNACRGDEAGAVPTLCERREFVPIRS